MKIAVLLTTFNRREKTLACLSNLAKQVLPEDTVLEVFLTDDNSADGTASLVQDKFPGTHVFHGNGQLYWAGGMRSTWREAMRHNADAYLLLNDDTLMFENSIAALIDTSNKYKSSICVGSTRDDESGELSYGGWNILFSKYWSSKKVFSETEVLDCDFANANIMLVPKEVVAGIGILSDQFTHSLADYDYCLKAKKHGFSTKLVPGFLGTCIDDHRVNWKSRQSTLKERLQYLKSPKGLNYNEYLGFIREHFPLSYPSAFLKLWAKTLFPFIWDRFKKIPA